MSFVQLRTFQTFNIEENIFFLQICFANVVTLDVLNMESKSDPIDLKLIVDIFLIEEYRILGKKGEGTFSEVLKCQNVHDGTWWAMKKMKQTYKR